MSVALKVGDKVLIAHKIEGRGFGWVRHMDSTVGKVGTVIELHPIAGGKVDLGSVGLKFWYPREALELQPDTPKHKFKVGDRVRALMCYLDITQGCVYTVCGVEGRRVGVIDNGGEPNFLMAKDACEAVNLVDSFVINGASGEYPTLEAAEAGVKAVGNNGTTYEIAQIVKRVKVKRETVVTLEEKV